MSDWSKLSKVGQQKVLSAIPRGGAEKDTRFAFKIKKVIWSEGKYCMDVVVRTPDLSIILTSKRWDVYPSMLPEDIQKALDYDVYDDSWYICELEENPNSNASPKRTKFKLLDTQCGLAGMPGSSSPPPPTTAGGGSPLQGTPPATPEQEGPPKPAAGDGPDIPGPVPDSERGQPQVGEAMCVPTDDSPAACLPMEQRANVYAPEEGEPCPHKHALALGDVYCKDCGERVG